MIADLTVVERSDEQVSLAHVRQVSGCIERSCVELVEDDACFLQVWSVLRPKAKQVVRMTFADFVPALWIALDAKRELFPQKCCVLTRGRLALIEQRWTCSPSNGRRESPVFVGVDD